MASIVHGFMWEFINRKPTRLDLTLYFGEGFLLLGYASCYASIPLRQVLGFFLPGQSMDSVESWLRGKWAEFFSFLLPGHPPSKCTEMHTSQAHTKPNWSRLHLTGIGLCTYHVISSVQIPIFVKTDVRIIGEGGCAEGYSVRSTRKRHRRHIDKKRRRKVLRTQGVSYSGK